MTQIIILGATGSVGETTFRVVQAEPERVSVDGLVANTQGERLWAMGRALQARWIGMADGAAGAALRRQHPSGAPRIAAGMDDILAEIAASPATKVIGAMSGFSGLLPTLTALENGKDILLANKETMVAAGDLVQKVAHESGRKIIPVDSEHSAIFQCLAPGQPVRRILLTCSGGPFRGRSREDLRSVTVEDALHHPNWSMGAKITVDSATLMNKGLELIEAHHLFSVPYEQVEVLIHPQSIVHSLVEFVDGATMAQLGWPDMAVPVQVALSWPERWPMDSLPLDLTRRPLTFDPPDTGTFEALTIARQAGLAGGLMPTVLNAANEVAVSLFLARSIQFLSIIDIIKEVLNDFADNEEVSGLAEILEADQWARTQAADVAMRYRQ